MRLLTVIGDLCRRRASGPRWRAAVRGCWLEALLREGYVPDASLRPVSWLRDGFVSGASLRPVSGLRPVGWL